MRSIRSAVDSAAVSSNAKGSTARTDSRSDWRAGRPRRYRPIALSSAAHAQQPSVLRCVRATLRWRRRCRGLVRAARWPSRACMGGERLCVCVSVRARACVRAPSCVCARVRARVRACVRACVRAYMCVFVCACVRAGAMWRSRTMTAPWAARYYHTSVVDAAGAIYVIGGWNSYNGTNTYFNDVFVSTDGGARPDSGVGWLGVLDKELQGGVLEGVV
jgi:hypothetical protein